MQSILTQCPRCQTSFKVSDKQLAIAEGMVRCGSCLDVFSAPANRITIKQPASADALADPLQEDYEEEEDLAEQTSADDTSSGIGLKAGAATPSLSAVPEALELNYAVTLQYGVRQLADGDKIAADASASSNADEDMDFVLDDDIPFGDMMLADTDDNDLEADEHEDDVPEANQVPEPGAAIPADEVEIIEVTNASAAFAATETGMEFVEEIPSGDSAQLQQEPAIPPVLHEDYSAAYNESAVPAEQDSSAVLKPEHPQDSFDEIYHELSLAEESAPAREATAALSGDSESHTLEGAELTPAREAVDQSQHTPINQEALYEAYVANILEEAAAEEPQEIMAHRPGAHRDDSDDLDAADSFTAGNFPDIDEFHAPGFSALTMDDSNEAEEFAVTPAKAQSRHDKEELRQYLADLEDADALEPLPATTMDSIEADPLTIEVGHTFRKYVTTFGWFCLSVILLAAFVLQVVANNLELMQKSPLYSRYLPIFCRVLACPEPEPATAGIQSLYSQELLVRSHPRVADALEVSFIFRNDAELPQAFPLIELSFRDSNKRLMANRLFKPEEYLPPELAVLDLMPARSSVQVMLELADPGSDAVDYEIVFREAADAGPNNPAARQ